MYKVMQINEASATRTILLENQTTQAKDLCFDDSALVSNENFKFIEEGQTYDCKIKLVGQFVSTRTSKSIDCTVIDGSVTVGKRKLIQIRVGQDIYYVENSKADGNKSMAFFEYYRKDLIQVNATIHSDLRER